ncbi:MAG: GC-type dockerin domain-anchored protein [Phycisphaerales bacterium]|jgi:hypothetical protein
MTHRIASIIAIAGIAAAANAQFTSYGDRAGWEADPIVGGSFDLEDWSGFAIADLNPSSGIIATDWGTIEVTGIDNPGASIDGGIFNGEVFPTTGHVSYIFTFDTPINAMGWDTFGAASGIAIAIETDQGVADLLDFVPQGSFDDSFLGFTSDTPITEVRIVASPSYTGTAVGEIFDADDMVFAGGAAPCRADFDGDGELTLFDFLAFQNAFDAGDLAADFDGDGQLTLFDFLAFQNEFDAGC